MVVLLLICILITLLGAWPVVGYLALGFGILWVIWWAFKGLFSLFPNSIETSDLPVEEDEKRKLKRVVWGLIIIGMLTILSIDSNA